MPLGAPQACKELFLCSRFSCKDYRNETVALIFWHNFLEEKMGVGYSYTYFLGYWQRLPTVCRAECPLVVSLQGRSLTNSERLQWVRVPLRVYELELAGKSAGLRLLTAGPTSGKDQCCRSPGETGLVWSPSSVSQGLRLDLTCWGICHFTFLYSVPHSFWGLGLRVTLWQPVPPHPPHQKELGNPFSTLLCHRP